MELYKKNGNILYILNVLKKYSDEEHPLTSIEIQNRIQEVYQVTIDSRTIRRNINLLKEKFEYEISTRNENGKGYYISKNPDTDFEQGEIRAILDNFSYANYIVPSIAKGIVKKCKNMQNIYENEKLKDYPIYSKDNKTNNMEVIKNIEDIVEAIQNKTKIQFEYWKYTITDQLQEIIVSSPVVSPYALIFDKQEFYLVGIKEEKQELYHYRVDRIKNLKILSEKITIKRNKKQIQEYVESTVEMYGGEKEKIEANVDIKLLNPVLDQFGKNITIIKKNKEEFKLIVDANPKGFRIWAMRTLELVEVIKPIHLRREIEDIIKNATKKYGC